MTISKPSTKRKKSLSACKPNFSAMNLYPHLYMTNSTQTYDRLPDPILSGNQFVSQNNSQNNQQQRLRSLGTMNYQNGQKRNLMRFVNQSTEKHLRKNCCYSKRTIQKHVQMDCIMG